MITKPQGYLKHKNIFSCNTKIEFKKTYSQEQFLNYYLAGFFNKNKLILSGQYTVIKALWFTLYNNSNILDEKNQAYLKQKVVNKNIKKYR